MEEQLEPASRLQLRERLRAGRVVIRSAFAGGAEPRRTYKSRVVLRLHLGIWRQVEAGEAGAGAQAFTTCSRPPDVQIKEGDKEVGSHGRTRGGAPDAKLEVD